MSPLPKPNIHPPVRPLRGEPVRAVLAFGSNLGDRETAIRGAVDELDAHNGIRLVALSALMESVAVTAHGEDADAPAYLNAVAVVRTTLTPHELLDTINGIEDSHGRVRAERWGDRTLDIDIIAYGQSVISDDRLTVPHPRAAERTFVLEPWLEIDPEAVLPEAGRVDELLQMLRRDSRDGTGP
ncbi:2-amino-4-hydroxy-6-hydroxymethyldihydropteridine diphosphokinase [Okibacterium endophyticum]